MIVRDGDRLRGHNTDVDGVRAGLAALLPKNQATWPRQALVLGAGGGARAVVAVLIGFGFQRVAVFNRHLHKAEAVVAHFARAARQMELRALPWHETIMEAELGRAKLVVNASGIGAEEGTSPIPTELLPAGLFVLDLVLNHASTIDELADVFDEALREVDLPHGANAGRYSAFKAKFAELDDSKASARVVDWFMANLIS